MNDKLKPWLCYECFETEVMLSEIDIHYRGKDNLCPECKINPPKHGLIIERNFTRGTTSYIYPTRT